MKDIKDFLRESNAIESVWDEKSLKQALKAWKYLIKRPELTVSDILQTHEILMKDKLDPEDCGAFRKRPVWIGGKEGKPWYMLPELMADWIDLANDTCVKGLTDEEIIKQMHINFEAIHPFIDGNGRMGRILMNWQRVKAGLPVLVIKEEEKWDYYKWFQS